MDEFYDLAVIGGGPAGLSAAVNAVIRGCKAIVLDSGSTLLARAERIDNYLGLPGVSGFEMMAGFIAQALDLGVEIEKTKANNLLPMGSQCMVSYGSKVISAKAAILALGVVREQPVAGEEAYLGKGVSYCATCDGALYKGKSALVYGLAKDAPEEANYLADLGVQVAYVSPGKRPDALKPEIGWHKGVLESILGGATVQGARVSLGSGDETGQDGESRAEASGAQREAGAPDRIQEFPVDGVFILREAIAPQSLISGIQMLDGFISVDKGMRTNLPGIFACGDCTGPPLQVAKSVGEGLVAGLEAAKYIQSL